MSQTDYNFLSRLQHRLALGSPFLAQAAFELEDTLVPDNLDSHSAAPVYIAGLARSGSTILLNALYQTGVFRSLTYRDMPFVLMSGTWRKLTRQKHAGAAKERAHGDRLQVNEDSAEAFEEVFWRIFCGEHYIAGDKLTPHTATPETLQQYRRFVAHVLHSRDSDTQVRYLAKNNNNLLRLQTVARAFGDARILIPFRHPVQQSISLLNQHRRFCERHKEDPFSSDYMNWLGHYEFGPGRKHYAYREKPPAYEVQQLEYWLENWLHAYTYAQATAPKTAIFLSYEETCKTPVETFSQLFSQLQVAADPAAAASYYAAAQPRNAQLDETPLLQECIALYETMQLKHLKPDSPE